MHTALSVQHIFASYHHGCGPHPPYLSVPLLTLLLSENETAATKVMFPECP